MTTQEQTRIALRLVDVQDAMSRAAELMHAAGGEYAEHAAELRGAKRVIDWWLNAMNEDQCEPTPEAQP